MAEVNIRILQDADGVQYYPVTHIEAIDGLDGDDVIALAARVATLEAQVINLQNQINDIVANM